MGKHDPDRDGDVHPDTGKQLDPKEFVIQPADADNDDGDDDDG
jgi:hypothetical protein